MTEISLHILDLAQNAISAGARHIGIDVEEDAAANLLTVSICDDGCGMDAEMVQRVQDPFVTSRKTRKVGLGIPMFREGCLRCNGNFALSSCPGEGTTIRGSYHLDHIDRQPLGDLAGTIFLLVSANPTLDFHLRHGRNGQEFVFDTGEVRAALQGVPLDLPEVTQWIKDCLVEGENDLLGGALA